MKPIKPGTDNRPAGTYQEVGPRGGNVPGGRIVHIDQGDRLPPTQKPGNGWVKNQASPPTITFAGICVMQAQMPALNFYSSSAKAETFPK